MTSPNSFSVSETDTNTSIDYKSVIQTAWAKFQSLAETENKNEVLSDLKPVLERFDLGIFRLVVMGEIKKGKSSFINALLSKPGLLPTASDVATSTVFKIIYGPEQKCKVFFQPDEDTNRSPEPLEVNPDNLKEYGTEDGNPGNKKRVDFIGIELPHALLKQGLVIVDTPGVGGLFKKHRDITWRYAPSADAICFVVDSTDTVISKDEIDFLKNLTGKITKRVFFVQTKTDIAGLEQCQAWERRNKDLLTANLGISSNELVYFPVSSERKVIADKKSKDPLVLPEELMRHLERSGFIGVMDFLNQGLLKQKEKLLAQETAKQLSRACSDLERELKDKARIVRVHSKEELDVLANQYGEAQKFLEKWERTTYREEMQRFSDKYAELKLNTNTKLQTELDPTGPIFNSIIDPLRSMEFDPEQVNQLAGQIQQECLDQAAQVVMKIQSTFNQQALTMIGETAGNLAKDFLVTEDARLLQGSISGPIKIEDSLHIQFSTFDNVRTALYGGMAGSAIASVGIGILTAIFPPAGAVALIATMLGGYFGGQEAMKIQTQKNRQQVIQALSNLLSQTINKAANQARNQFSESALLLERKARDTFQQATERTRAELQNRLKDVQDARVRSQKDVKAKEEEIDRKLNLASVIISSLNSILPQTQTA
jgi:signal recognition particle receptor subunit beta